MRRSGGLPDFPDPFGTPGLGGSLFSNFFNEDPFDDPFFRQPFGSMFGPSPLNSMFGRQATPFGQRLLGNSRGLFQTPQQDLLNQLSQQPLGGPRGLFQTPQQNYLPEFSQQTSSPPQSRVPMIQEVLNDDSSRQGHGHRQSNRQQQQPIVEHPDDDEGGHEDDQNGTQADQPVPHTVLQTMENPSAVSRYNNRGTSSRSFSFQSYSVTYSGIGGQKYYSSSSSRKQGPNGVFEEHHQKEDSSGNKDMSLSRGIGEKGRTIARSRDSQGVDRSKEILHNLSHDEAATFDETWQEHARQNLHGWAGGAGSQAGRGRGVGRAAPALLEALPRQRRRVTHPADGPGFA